MHILSIFQSEFFVNIKQTLMFTNVFICRFLQSNDTKSLVNSKTVFQSFVRMLATREFNVWRMLRADDMLPTTVKF